MANEEHVDILKQGVEVWNKWREENPEVRPDLNEAVLIQLQLHKSLLNRTSLVGRRRMFSIGANLRYANLHRADLRAANLADADLSEANLSCAHLTGANLSRVNLAGADLSGVHLDEAKLNWVNLSGARLSEADLTNATVGITLFCDVDLSNAKGLDTVSHAGPSTIGINTITKSKGNIPEIFLRGAGVPDIFIAYMQSLTGAALDFYSCFISHSSKDQDFAERLHNDLQAKGVRCWFAPHDIQGGKKIHEQIDQAIRVYDKLLVILSEHSMGSEWVKTEVYNARQQELTENRRKLFPLSLVDYDTVRQWRAFDADIGKDMAREVREYFIPDFTNWPDYSAYQKAFERLLRDLKTER